MVLLLEKYVQYYTIINIIIIITFKSYQSCLLFLFPSAFHLQPDESDLQLSSSLLIHFPKTSHFSYTFSHTSLKLHVSLTILSHFPHISLTILSHFSHTSLTFLLHFPHTSLTLLSNFPHISLTLPTHFSHTSLTLLSQFSHTSLTFLLHFSYTSLTLFSVCVLPTIWNCLKGESPPWEDSEHCINHPASSLSGLGVTAIPVCILERQTYVGILLFYHLPLLLDISGQCMRFPFSIQALMQIANVLMLEIFVE